MSRLRNPHGWSHGPKPLTTTQCLFPSAARPWKSLLHFVLMKLSLVHTEPSSLLLELLLNTICPYSFNQCLALFISDS